MNFVIALFREIVMRFFLLFVTVIALSSCIQLTPDSFSAPYCKDSKMALQWRQDYAAKNNLPIDYTNELGMKFTLVPPGLYLIGSPNFEKTRSKIETQHLVTLTKGYYIGVMEVTQKEWGLVKKDNPSKFNGELLPVEHVLFEDAAKFAKDYAKDGVIKYRLPTEAEWEIACRAGSETPYNGLAPLQDLGWYHSNAEGAPHAVASKLPNAFGIYDMHGNVWEWTSDTSGEYPEGSQIDPKISNTGGGNRVKRGGSFATSSSFCRSAYRNLYAPLVFRQANTGFRLVFDAELLKPQ